MSAVLVLFGFFLLTAYQPLHLGWPGNRKVVTLSTWQLGPKSQEWKPPGEVRTIPTNGIASFLPHSTGTKVTEPSQVQVDGE